jgi:4'-phosphopantetheinyl transferase
MRRLPGRRELRVHRFDVGGLHVLRARTRETLAAYLGCRPDALEIRRGVHGKPFLAGPGEELSFSVARSGETGVLAVARGADVGVDVERIDPARALGPIADALFSEQERAELRALAGERRIGRFFELWTRKEAVAKALGVGLAVPLGRLQAPAGWQLEDLDLGAGLAGAVCVAGRRRVVLVP